jgi:poly(A)-specific ribonuclease
MDDYRRQAEMKIKAAIGFRHVIDLLSSEKKLIVGHNCFLGMTIGCAFQDGVILIQY